MKLTTENQILISICDNPGCQISDMPGKYFHVARMLSRLREQGLVYHEVDAEDRRVRRFYPTEKGKAVACVLRDFIEKYQEVVS